MMEIFRILDEMELMIKNSKRVPLSNGKAIIEAHIFLDRLDRIRAVLPEELDEARLLLSEKDRIVQKACAEAGEYLEDTKSQVARMIDESEITKNAMSLAEDIVSKAEQVANEIRRDANEYADGVLSHMEIVLNKGLDAIRRGRDDIQDALEKGDY